MAEPTGRLEAATRGDPPRVHLLRRDGVDDTFWLQVRGELGGRARGAREIVVPAERFLARRYLLAQACKRYRVAFDPDDRTRELLVERQEEQKRLREIQETKPRLDAEEVRERLRNTRFRRTLRPFQMRDMRRLLALPHGANFSVPGAGKTCVTYALYEAERMAGRVDRMLVVAPLSAFDAWEREAELCLEPSPNIHRYRDRIPHHAEVLVTGYQRMWSRYDELAAWAARHNTHLVLDEAHRIKRGRDGEWGSKALDLAYAATRRDILTGTPAPKQPDDLDAQLDFMWPSHGRNVLPEAVKGSPPWPDDAGERIAEAIGPLFVRTRKDELNLPPVEHDPVYVPLTGLQEDIYHALRQRYAGQFRHTRRDQLQMSRMGRVVMYLLEAATNPALLVSGSSDKDPEPFRHPPLEVEEDAALLDLLSDYPDYETPEKFLTLYEILKNKIDDGRKVLVWSNFVHNIEILEQELARYEPALLYGDIKQVVADPAQERSRQQEIERFRHDPDCRLMLANPAAASEGMSLHDVCHDAIYLERTFNAGQYLQSVNRIHRLGLEPGTTTHITHLITRNTIDEIVDDRIRDRAERLGQMLRDPNIAVMELPDPEDYGLGLRETDYRALIDHLTRDDGA